MTDGEMGAVVLVLAIAAVSLWAAYRVFAVNRLCPTCGHPRRLHGASGCLPRADASPDLSNRVLSSARGWRHDGSEAAQGCLSIVVVLGGFAAVGIVALAVLVWSLRTLGLMQ